MIASSVSVSGAGLQRIDRGHGDVADIVQQRGDSQRVLTFAIEPRFATERDGERREAARRTGSVRIVPLDHAHHGIDHALHGHVGALQRAERHGMRTLRLQHAPDAIGQRRQRSLIFFAVAGFAIANAQHRDGFIARDHRHCEIALQVRQAILLRLARQIVARGRVLRAHAIREQAGARERARLGIDHRCQRLAAIAPGGERDRLARRIDEIQIRERAAGDVRGLVDHAAHDRGFIEVLGLLEQVDQEFELALAGALRDGSRRRCDTSRISTMLSPAPASITPTLTSTSSSEPSRQRCLVS